MPPRSLALALAAAACTPPADPGRRDPAPELADAPTASSLVAPGSVVDGSVRIENSLDVAALRGVEEITGSLEIGRGLSAVALPDLRRIGGTLTLAPASDLPGPALEALSLPALVEVGHDVTLVGVARIGWVEDTHLAELDLRSLAAVGGSLTLRDHPALTELSLGDLTDVFQVTLELAGLRSLDLRALAEADVLALGLPALEEVDLRAYRGNSGEGLGFGAGRLRAADLRQLRRARSLTVGGDCAAPPAVRAGRVARVGTLHLECVDGSDLTWLGPAVSVRQALSLSALPALRSLDGLVPVASPAEVVVTDSPALRDLGALDPITDLRAAEFSRNAGLCRSEIDAFLAGVTVRDTTVIRGNDGGC